MPLEALYLEKAEQCGRLSNTATDVGRRFALLEEAERWREIAADIARQERSEWPR
jgi:hypothetical protein